MLNLRHNFGIAASGDYIYMVGGINYKEGTLMKCEKFNIITKETFPINFLNTKSSHHSVCNFKDKFLFKFGGLRNSF
jgi:hypothetical protein